MKQQRSIYAVLFLVIAVFKPGAGFAEERLAEGTDRVQHAAETCPVQDAQIAISASGDGEAAPDKAIADEPPLPAPPVLSTAQAEPERVENPVRNIGSDGASVSAEPVPASLQLTGSGGAFIPVLRYAERYGSAVSFGADVSLPLYSVGGFYPVLALTYADMKTKPDPEYVSSRMALFTGTLGARRSFRFESPALLKDNTFLTRGWHLDAGAYAGMTRVSFTSDIQHSPVVDTVATLGLSCGAYLTILEHLDAGVQVSAQRIFTAGVPLDSVGVSLCVAGSW